MPAPDIKRNRKLKVLVNPFSGKVSDPFQMLGDPLGEQARSSVPVTLVPNFIG